MWEMWVWSLGQEDPLEKEMASHSNILAWRISWTEKPGGLQATGSQRVRHDWSDLVGMYECIWVLCVCVLNYTWVLGFDIKCVILWIMRAPMVVQTLKNLPIMWETWVQSLSWEDSPGEGNSYPLHYSGLENSMDRGAWQAMGHKSLKNTILNTNLM